MAVFFDSNILVYSIDATSPAKQARAIALMGVAVSEASGVVSTQVLQEFYNIVTRKLGVSAESAGRIARRYAQLRTVSMTSEIVFAAMDRHAAAGFSFWDALIVEAALVSGADTLYTEDLHDGLVIGRMTIRNPFAPA